MLKLRQKFMSLERQNELLEIYDINTAWVSVPKRNGRTKSVDVWDYDNNLAQLFADSEIEVGRSCNVEKQFKTNEYNNPVGLNYGDYIETVELKQKGKSYYVPAYCINNEKGASYGLAIFERVKVK